MMSRNGIFVILGACVIAGLLVAGCTQSQAPAAVQTTAVPATVTSSETAAPVTPTTNETAPVASMANPASVNCGTIGGTTEIKTAADGSQYGMCSFSNGTSCEEWALYRNEGCQPGVSANTTVVVTTMVAGNTTPDASANTTVTTITSTVTVNATPIASAGASIVASH